MWFTELSENLTFLSLCKVSFCYSSCSCQNLEVNTIDSFQGQERDVIIMSCVRTGGIGFLADTQRLNVALTRARRSLLLCGNFTSLRVGLWNGYHAQEYTHHMSSLCMTYPQNYTLLFLFTFRNWVKKNTVCRIIRGQEAVRHSVLHLPVMIHFITLHIRHTAHVCMVQETYFVTAFRSVGTFYLVVCMSYLRSCFLSSVVVQN